MVIAQTIIGIHHNSAFSVVKAGIPGNHDKNIRAIGPDDNAFFRCQNILFTAYFEPKIVGKKPSLDLYIFSKNRYVFNFHNNSV